MNPLPGARNSRDARRSEISEKPEDQQDDDQDFEQLTSFGIARTLAPRSGERVAPFDFAQGKLRAG